MFDSILTCCSSSYKPMAIGGSVVSFIFGILLSFMHNIPYVWSHRIDSSIWEPWYIYILFVLLTMGLFMIAMNVLYGTYKKIPYRASLFLFTWITLVIAFIALAIVPGQLKNNEQHMIQRLESASKMYNFSLEPEQASNNSSTPVPVAVPITATTPWPPLPTTAVSQPNGTTPQPDSSTHLDSATATQIWDMVQSAGCCGLRSSTDWGSKIPKTCCHMVDVTSFPSGIKEFTCAQPDADHKTPCIDILQGARFSVQLFLQMTLALVTILTLVATIEVCCSPRKYEQASQSAI